ncbi:MAG: polymer-forming cytoskeletal protein [Bryobacteraceae bacterium]
MWNRRKDEEEVTRPPSGTPSGPEFGREAMPVSNMPVKSYEPEAPRGTATLGKSVLVKGQIVSKEDLVIDGNVEGSVEAQEHRITIGPNGRVVANVKARDVVVLGLLKGNIEASGRVDIRKGANLVGDIRYAKISIEEGADLRGSLEMIRLDEKADQSKAPETSPKPVVEKPIQQSLGASASGINSK